MKDCTGTELKVGDQVVCLYARGNFTTLYCGIADKITERSVMVKYKQRSFFDWRTDSRITASHHILKLSDDPFARYEANIEQK